MTPPNEPTKYLRQANNRLQNCRPAPSTAVLLPPISQIDRQTDKQTDGRTDGRTDRQTGAHLLNLTDGLAKVLVIPVLLGEDVGHHFADESLVAAPVHTAHVQQTRNIKQEEIINDVTIFLT